MRGSSVAIALAIGLAIGLAAPALASDDDLRSVAAMQYHERVLLVFAPSLRDPRMDRQRAELAHFGAGAAARDLVLVQVDETRVLGAHDKAERLRARFHVAADGFRTLLIGKDGTVALDRPAPISAIQLRDAIDAMPMRQEEVRRAKAGQPLPKD